MNVVAKPLRGSWPGIGSKRQKGEKIWISEQKAIISLYSIYIYSFYKRDEMCLLRGTRSVLASFQVVTSHRRGPDSIPGQFTSS